MRSFCVRAALALGLVCAAVEGAAADDWWMLKNTEQGRECGPPLEADGVVLTPGEILNRFEECKLMDQRGLRGAREGLTLPAWITHGRMCRSGASPE
jgi:hypothetical protein